MIIKAGELANIWVTGFRLSNVTYGPCEGYEDNEVAYLPIDRMYEVNKHFEEDFIKKGDELCGNFEAIFLEDFFVAEMGVFIFIDAFGSRL